jgi:UDP-glucose-4-epimerase GalE
MRILVTGGAGYIGGAFVRVAREAGHEVLILDNLSTGHRDAVPAGVPLTVADLRDRARLDPLLARCDAVAHFAALSIVPDSIADPVGYYQENLGGFLALLEAIQQSGPRLLLFSSSAAVYGAGEGRPFREDDPLLPVNPYGGTKLAIEQTLAQVAPAMDLRYLCLRYFNAAGALADHGERHQPETHLIPLALEAALGRRELTLFGADYDTPDGTCVRDYIHIADLAQAHLVALDALRGGGLSGGAINLGTGRGHSVREVVDTVAAVSGLKVPFRQGPRRPGDPARLVAAVDKAAGLLGWSARRPALRDIVESAWNWLRAKPLAG